MDTVFRALADPTRRSLLDELFGQDGQTLGQLEERFSMTRFGVMKHLKQLEDAGLVVTRRRGREKLHFLNPVPIRLVHDRWVSKYAEPWAAALSGLKTRMESQMEKFFDIYIRTTPERLWQALTDGEIRSKYNFGLRSWTSRIGTGFRKCNFSRPRRLVTTRPASSSCLRCFMTPKRDMPGKRRPSAPRVWPSSRNSSSRTLRRVGSAKALKTVSTPQ